MKRFLAPILLMVFLFPSLALGQAVSMMVPSSPTMDDLVERDGLYYEKFTDVPFSGEVTGRQQGSFKNGKEEGPLVHYTSDGTVDEELTGTFKNGVKVD